MRIATGAPLPGGANAVAMLENCRERAAGLLEVESALTPWENVSRVGEDVRKGERLLPAGARLGPADIALASALGLGRLRSRAVRAWASSLRATSSRTPGRL